MEILHRFFSKVSVAWNNNKLISVVGILILIFSIYFIQYISEHAKPENGSSVPYLDETQLVAGIITILSIIFVIATLLQSKSLYEADLLAKYDEKYESQEMCDNLRLLRDFSSVQEMRDVCHLVRTDRYNEDRPLPIQKKGRFWESIDGVDKARRAVKFYFINALDLYLEGKISQEVMRRICNKSGILTFFNVVEPMEAYLNPEYDYTKFRRIMMLTTDIWREQKKTDMHFATSSAATTTSASPSYKQTLEDLIRKIDSLKTNLERELAALNATIKNIENTLRAQKGNKK